MIFYFFTKTAEYDIWKLFRPRIFHQNRIRIYFLENRIETLGLNLGSNLTSLGICSYYLLYHDLIMLISKPNISLV